MNIASSPRIAKLLVWTRLLLGWKTNLIFHIGHTYISLMEPLHLGLLAHVGSRLEAYEKDSDLIGGRFQVASGRLSSLQTLPSPSGFLGTVRFIRRYTVPTFRDFGTLLWFRFRFLALRIENNLSGALICFTSWVVDQVGDEVAVSKRRIFSLKEILERVQGPITFAELILWSVTRAKHSEEILGDFREAFEKQSRRFGNERALEWSEEQIRRELWARVESTVRFLGWVRNAIHHVRHFMS